MVCFNKKQAFIFFASPVKKSKMHSRSLSPYRVVKKEKQQERSYQTIKPEINVVNYDIDPTIDDDIHVQHKKNTLHKSNTKKQKSFKKKNTNVRARRILDKPYKVDLLTKIVCLHSLFKSHEFSFKYKEGNEIYDEAFKECYERIIQQQSALITKNIEKEKSKKNKRKKKVINTITTTTADSSPHSISLDKPIVGILRLRHAVLKLFQEDEEVISRGLIEKDFENTNASEFINTCTKTFDIEKTSSLLESFTTSDAIKKTKQQFEDRFSYNKMVHTRKNLFSYTTAMSNRYNSFLSFKMDVIQNASSKDVTLFLNHPFFDSKMNRIKGKALDESFFYFKIDERKSAIIMMIDYALNHAELIKNTNTTTVIDFEESYTTSANPYNDNKNGNKDIQDQPVWIGSRKTHWIVLEGKKMNEIGKHVSYLMIEKATWLYVHSSWLKIMNPLVPSYKLLLKHWFFQSYDPLIDRMRKANVIDTILKWIYGNSPKSSHLMMSVNDTYFDIYYEALFKIINLFKTNALPINIDGLINIASTYKGLNRDSIDITYINLLYHIKRSFLKTFITEESELTKCVQKPSNTTHEQSLICSVRDMILFKRDHAIERSIAHDIYNLFQENKLNCFEFPIACSVITDVVKMQSYVHPLQYNEKDGEIDTCNKYFLRITTPCLISDGYDAYSALGVKNPNIDERNEVDDDNNNRSSNTPYITDALKTLRKHVRSDDKLGLLSLYMLCASGKLPLEYTQRLFLGLICVKHKDMTQRDVKDMNGKYDNDVYESTPQERCKTAPVGWKEMKKIYEYDALEEKEKNSYGVQFCNVSKLASCNYLWNDPSLAKIYDYERNLPKGALLEAGFEDILLTTDMFLCLIERLAQVSMEPDDIKRLDLVRNVSYSNVKMLEEKIERDIKTNNNNDTKKSVVDRKDASLKLTPVKIEIKDDKLMNHNTSEREKTCIDPDFNKTVNVINTEGDEFLTQLKTQSRKKTRVNNDNKSCENMIRYDSDHYQLDNGIRLLSDRNKKVKDMVDSDLMIMIIKPLQQAPHINDYPFDFFFNNEYNKTDLEDQYLLYNKIHNITGENKNNFELIKEEHKCNKRGFTMFNCGLDKNREKISENFLSKKRKFDDASVV